MNLADTAKCMECTGMPLPNLLTHDQLETMRSLAFLVTQAQLNTTVLRMMSIGTFMQVCARVHFSS